MSDLHLPDVELVSAAQGLALAADLILADNLPHPSYGFESLTGIEGEVDRYLHGVSVARAALADGARAAGRGVCAIMTDGSRLDAELTSALSAGYAVKGVS